MRLRSLVLSVLSSLALLAPRAEAQGGGRRDGAPGQQGMQREIRQRFAQVVQRELALDDTRMRRLQATLQKFDEPRRDLMRRENEVRRDLRMQLRAGDSVQQSRVESLLDEMLAVQKRRIELHEQEDRELRGFLTPLQRAQYYGLQEQLRKRVEDMQSRRRPPGGGRPPL